MTPINTLEKQYDEMHNLILGGMFPREAFIKVLTEEKICCNDFVNCEQACKPRADHFFNAIDEELINCYLSPMLRGESAKSAINRIIHWNKQIALDPKLSEDARDLLIKGCNPTVSEIQAILKNRPDLQPHIMSILDFLDELQHHHHDKPTV